MGQYGCISEKVVLFYKICYYIDIVDQQICVVLKSAAARIIKVIEGE